MTKQLQTLRQRIFGKKGGVEQTTLTPIIKVIRELGCFSEIVGRNFVVKDKDGNVVYTIRQKPITFPQLNTFIKELYTLEKLEQEAAEKAANKNKLKRKSSRR